MKAKEMKEKIICKYQKKCETCPLGWEERLIDDWDGGCNVDGDWNATWWCIAPMFIRKMKAKSIEKKENKFWDKIIKQETLYEKYTVIKNETKEHKKNCFVITPEKDKASLEALKTYAQTTDNFGLKVDIMEWIKEIEKERK